MDIQNEIQNTSLSHVESMLPVGGFFFKKDDIVIHPTSLWDKSEFSKLDAVKMTTEPNPGFSISGWKNPFKPHSFTVNCQLSEPESGEVVAEIVNFLLSSWATYIQVPCDLVTKLFPPALWCSRMLVSFLSGNDPKVWLHTGVYSLGKMSVFYIPHFDGYPLYICSRYVWQYCFNSRI